MSIVQGDGLTGCTSAALRMQDEPQCTGHLLTPCLSPLHPLQVMDYFTSLWHNVPAAAHDPATEAQQPNAVAQNLAAELYQKSGEVSTTLEQGKGHPA